MQDLKNRVVWITGASSGIGEATAYVLAKKGCKLVLSARRESELLRVKQQTQLPDEEILVLPMDVEKFDTFDELFQQVLGKFGTIDVLFNNAGISQRGDVETTKLEVYQKLMNVNFFGVVALTKVVLPFMRKQNNGHIVVTSSVSGKLGTPLRSGYCAAKHAIQGFFDSLRYELTHENVEVTIICPGYINTDISLSALKADGTPYAIKDTNQAQGLDVKTCAEQIVAAIEQNKKEVYMGKKEVLGVYLKRFFPNILDKILVKQAPK